MGKLLGRRDDDGLDLRGQAAVGVRNGFLVVEVHHVADAADDMPDAQLAADLDGQAVIGHDAHAVGHVGGGLPDDIHFLFVREEAAFVLVDTDGDNDLIEHRQGTAENVEVPRGEWIERARE